MLAFEYSYAHEVLKKAVCKKEKDKRGGHGRQQWIQIETAMAHR